MDWRRYKKELNNLLSTTHMSRTRGHTGTLGKSVPASKGARNACSDGNAAVRAVIRFDGELCKPCPLWSIHLCFKKKTKGAYLGCHTQC